MKALPAIPNTDIAETLEAAANATSNECSDASCNGTCYATHSETSPQLPPTGIHRGGQPYQTIRSKNPIESN